MTKKYSYPYSTFGSLSFTIWGRVSVKREWAKRANSHIHGSLPMKIISHLKGAISYIPWCIASYCIVELPNAVILSVRFVLTCVDKALHGFTSDFHVLVLKWISVVCERLLFCFLLMIAALIVISIIHRCSEYINRTMTAHAITSTSWAYVVEKTEIIKQQKDIYWS